jgi:S-adenosylmethionine decarboxylase proenzyme
MTAPVGIHILSQLHSCERVKNLDKETLSAKIVQLLHENQLTVLGEFYHEFEGGGITALIALAESHLALHTWPELSYLTLEIYVCNYSRDNSAAAEQVHAGLISFLEPGKVETNRLHR